MCQVYNKAQFYSGYSSARHLIHVVISDFTKTTNYYVVCFVCKQYSIVVVTTVQTSLAESL